MSANNWFQCAVNRGYILFELLTVPTFTFSKMYFLIFVSLSLFSRAAKDSKKSSKPSTTKKPAAAAPKNAQKKAATKGKQPMQKAAPRVGGKR